MNENKINPAVIGPDFAINLEEENLLDKFNNLQIKKKVSVKWSDNIIDNENYNHNSKAATRKKTPIKKKNKILKTERSKSKGKKSNNKKEEPKPKQNKNISKIEKFPSQIKKIEENENKIVDDGEEEDWDYLKRTMAKRDGKVMNDDFIKYNRLTAKLVEDEDDIINYHMNIIKEDARLLSQEGDLITNIKGVGKEEDFKMDEYIAGLDKIIEQKLKLYNNMRGKVDKYKKHIKEEDVLRQKLNPKFFMDE